MNFETSKNLGGIGAILMFIGFILPTATGGFGFILSLIGLILVLVGLKGLADYYSEAGIFNNFLYGTLAGVAGAVVAGLTFVLVVFTLLTDFLQTIFPTWDGDLATLPGLTPDIGAIQGAIGLDDVMPLLTSFLIILVILFFTAIIVAIFMRKSLNSLSAKSGVGLFGTAGLLLLIGAVLTIIVIGFLLIWIAMLIMAIAFFSMRPQQAQPEMSTGTSP